MVHAQGDAPIAPIAHDDFARRYQESFRALWCIAVGVCGDRSGADDLVQEAAAVALTKLHEFDARTSFLAWMSQIVRFLALNDRRKKGREREAHARPALIDAVAPRPLDQGSGRPIISGDGRMLDAAWVVDDRLAAAVGDLDPVQRSCLLLRVVGGLSYRDISLAVAIPEGTAMSHVHRARRTLLTRLKADSPSEEGGA